MFRFNIQPVNHFLYENDEFVQNFNRQGWFGVAFVLGMKVQFKFIKGKIDRF